MTNLEVLLLQVIWLEGSWLDIIWLEIIQTLHGLRWFGQNQYD